MENYHRQPTDTVTVHHNVLRAIVRESAIGVDGVVRLGHASGTADRWLVRARDGVQLAVMGDDISVEVSLIVEAQRNIYAISVKVQQEISRTLQEYVGLNVKAVNVHIEDVILGAN